MGGPSTQDASSPVPEYPSVCRRVQPMGDRVTWVRLYRGVARTTPSMCSGEGQDRRNIRSGAPGPRSLQEPKSTPPFQPSIVCQLSRFPRPFSYTSLRVGDGWGISRREEKRVRDEEDIYLSVVQHISAWDRRNRREELHNDAVLLMSHCSWDAQCKSISQSNHIPTSMLVPQGIAFPSEAIRTIQRK